MSNNVLLTNSQVQGTSFQNSSWTNSGVVQNDAQGNLTTTPRLQTANGGTGIDSSGATGVAKVNSGSWSASSIVDTDVSASAGIQTSKLAAGTPNQFLVNDSLGKITSTTSIANSGNDVIL